MAAPRGATRAQSSRTKYGYLWPIEQSDVDIEREMIKLGGRHWHSKKNQFCGLPLIEHYKRLWLLLWPNEEVDPWAELALKGWIENRILVLMGPKNTGKTNTMAKIALTDWWVWPNETLWLISSTTLKGAELRIYGRIKNLYNRAKELYPELEGRSLESLGCITNQRIEATFTLRNNNLARTLERGIVVVPCKSGTETVALSSFIGIKAPRLRHCGDEVSVTGDGFLNAYNNFVSEENNFKGMMAGNPTDLLDPLCRAAKPIGGWDTFHDTKKTQTWRSSFYNAFVICFDGRDTPNNGCPPGSPRYRHLITPQDVANTVRTNGEDQPITYMQVYGKPNRLLTSKRVITETLCREHGALDTAIWMGGGRISIYGLDPAYGGGDLCVGMQGEFGIDVSGLQVLKIYKPDIVPIRVSAGKDVEDQIAEWIEERLLQLNIAAVNCFYGAFGKGTLGNAFARVFGKSCPVPIDEGGSPSRRPVRADLQVTEADGSKRPMRCDEYYDRRISELWYSARLCVESNQMRELPSDVMDEGCLRIYRMVAGNRHSVETKEDLKKRMQGESPNKFDALTFVLEGARQRGFVIARLGEDVDSEQDQSWKREFRERAEKLVQSKQLNYAA